MINQGSRHFTELLGQRLLTEGDSSMKRNALICFVFAGDADELIKHWNSNVASPSEIQVSALKIISTVLMMEFVYFDIAILFCRNS